MQNPWEHLRQTPHFVLDMDKPFTAWHDQNKGQFDPAKRIHLELLPEPFLGRHEAPVTLLNLNPGFSPDDQALLPGLSRRLGEAGIQEKRVAIDEMWFNRLGEVIR